MASRHVTEAFNTTCAVHNRGLCGLVVVWLSWPSGRALVAQARGVLSLTPVDAAWPFLFSPHNIFISSVRQDALSILE